MHFSRKASSRLIFVGDDVDAFCMLLAGRSCLLSPLLSRLVDRLALCVCVCSELPSSSFTAEPLVT